MGNGTRRTGGGEDVLLLIGQAKGLCQVRCHIGAEARVALTGACLLYTSRYLRIPPLHREFRLPLHYSRKTVLKAVYGLST